MHSNRFGMVFRAALLAVCAPLVLLGCATPTPWVMPSAPQYPALPSVGLSAGSVLSAQAVAERVGADNAAIQVARAQLQVSMAHSAVAAALPDPSLNFALDHPVSAGDFVNALNQSVAMDLSALITRGARLDAAQAAVTAQRLQLSWLVLQKQTEASVLLLQLWAADAEQRVLAAQRDALQQSAQDTAAAVQHGWLTQPQALAVASNRAAIEQQQQALAAQQAQWHAALNGLMNLPPDTAWRLPAQQQPVVAVPAEGVLSQRLAQLADHRADLLALRAGVMQAEANYRVAILQQFPGVTLGGGTANDTSNVHTVGFSLGLTLPIFGSAQARVSAAQASRAALEVALQARINQAVAEVATAQAQRQALAQRLALLHAQLPIFAQAKTAQADALAAGYVPYAAYLAARTQWFETERAILRAQGEQAAAAIGLLSVLGLPPSVNFVAEPDRRVAVK